MARRGLILMALLVCTLMASPLKAHDVHDHGDKQQNKLVEPVAEDDVRDLLRRFRATGDDAWLERAWTSVDPELAGGNADVLVDAAFVAQARHDFDRALDLTRRALSMKRNFDQAWLLAASVHLVRGETAAAKEACRELQRVHWLAIVGCHARVSHARGNADEVRGQLGQLIAATPESGGNSELLAWAHGIAGDLAVAGNDVGQAIHHFRRSLDLAESSQVRAALVDVLIDERRLTEAQHVLDGGAGALPLDVRRMIVAKQSGRESKCAAAVAAANKEFQSWIAAEDWLHAREMSRFYLDVMERPELARYLAEINLSIQKEPEDQDLYWRTHARMSPGAQAASAGPGEPAIVAPPSLAESGLSMRD
ncbi:MAG: hypothetical protein WBN44_14085 [Woeseiaceae bacterium]